MQCFDNAKFRLIFRIGSLPIHFAQHNIDSSKDDNRIRYVRTQAHILQHRKVDQARRTHPVAIRIGGPVTDQKKSQLSLRRLNPPISLARPWGENPGSSSCVSMIGPDGISRRACSRIFSDSRISSIRTM